MVGLLSRNIRRCAAAFALCTILLVPAQANALRIVTYNLLNYTGGRADEFKAILNEIQPDIVVVQEIDSIAAVLAFRNDILNAPDGPGGFVQGPFHDNGNLNNAIFYRPTVATLISHIWFGGDYPRDTDRWSLRPATYTSDDAVFYVYSMHLAASNSGQRADQTRDTRDDANDFPPGTHFIYVGDFNIDSSSEQSYRNLVSSESDNDGRSHDPINQPGTWTNNDFYSGIHTQSTHNNNPGAGPGAATGGLDDRFDFQLISTSMDDQAGLAYVDDTYYAFGNDGEHFNKDINDPPTIPEGDAIADALHGASDHLPVLADYQVPASITNDNTLEFGTVIVGASAEQDLTVENDGDLELFGFVDDLTYDLLPDTGFDAPTGPFIEPAGGGANVHTITMLTGSEGDRDAILVIDIDSQGVNQAAVDVSLLGHVLRHAEPSLEAGQQILNGEIDFGSHPAGEFMDLVVKVYNFGYGSDQAQLEVYDALITGPDAERFSFVGGFTPVTLAGVPASFDIRFDDSAQPGDYQATMTFLSRDQQDLPGAIDRPDTVVELTATLTGGSACPEDIDGSGAVDFGDILAILAAWGPCGGECPEDLDHSGAVDFGDILAVLAAWGPCP